ncbi:hypothetical protein [Thalassospira povalilytica]|uniref:hypothetical protein n=1 Tax=Thalassospira povalilytica TaxID=732237 RepID=UPI003AA84BE3
MQIKLPWPHKDLSPNARKHFGAIARVKEAYKTACLWEMKAQKVREIEADAVLISLTFYPPGNYHYDRDNLMARMKYGLDMVAKQIGIDDRNFHHSDPVIEKSQDKRGHVIVDIQPYQPATEEQQIAQCKVCKAIAHHKKHQTAHWQQMRVLLAEMEQQI